MDEQRVIPGGRRGTPLYDRAGTILAAGVLILLAGLVQVAFAIYLFVVAATTVPDVFQELERVVRVVAAIVLAFGVAAIVVSGGVIQVRGWARVCALVYGAVSVLYALYLAAEFGDITIAMAPNLGGLVAALLLFPGVGKAFRQAKEERALLRGQRGVPARIPARVGR